MQIDFTTIILAVIAVALLARLWSLFGTRNEDEPLRPNPFIPQTPVPQSATISPMMQPVALPPASLAGGLQQVEAIDKSFSEKQFLKDSSAVFIAVVETYATGSLGSISDKLSPALLAHFQKAADARRAAGQTAQSRVAALKDVEAVAARAEGTQAFITVKFTSDQENILRDARGTIIGGAEGKTEEVTDLWTFTRDAAMPDAKWVVAETQRLDGWRWRRAAASHFISSRAMR